MASNFQPVFPRVAAIGSAILTTGNPNLDGSGALAILLTAGADGLRIDSLTVRPIGTNVASVLRIFITDTTISRLLKEVALPAYTVTQTATSDTASATIYFNGVDNPQVVLPSGVSMRVAVGTTGAAGWSVIAQGGSLTA